MFHNPLHNILKHIGHASPVFADIELRATIWRGWGRGCNESVVSGVVEAVLRASACSLADKLGVVVTALPVLVLALEREGILRRPQKLELALGELGALDHGSGEIRADWYTSKMEDEGVW